MSTAGGVGVKFGGCGVCSSYCRVFMDLKAITTAFDPPNTGTIDANGQYAHILYNGDLTNTAQSSNNPAAPDFTGSEISVEFDVKSVFDLPFPGHIYLIGGAGEYSYWINKIEPLNSPHLYVPTIHTLRTYKIAGSSFTIPDNHYWLFALNAGMTFTLPTGDILTPSPNWPGSPVMPGMTILFNNTGTVVTAWEG
jgi:hypothetical protein